MTPEQKTIVQTTFAQVIDADAVASMFYVRLFEIAPEVKPLFKGDISEQGKKLMQTLAVVVNSLNDLPTIVPAVEALGKRHVNYGVKAEHYDIIGTALLWTLGEAFGDAFTNEAKDAWAAAYDIVAKTAISAAYGEATV